MVAGRMADVISKLVFLLIPERRKQGDRRSKLIVAVRLKSRYGQRGGAEGKGQREAQSRVPSLCQVKRARVEHKRAQPGRIEGVSIADDDIPIVVVGGQSSGWQSGLLHQGIVRQVTVVRRA